MEGEKKKITQRYFLTKFRQLDSFNKHIEMFQDTIDKAVLRQKEFILNANRAISTGGLPSITISEILGGENSRLEPHLRASASYQRGNKRERFNIYIGKLSDFPDGKNDARAIEIARHKAYEYLCKKHPTIYGDEE